MVNGRRPSRMASADTAFVTCNADAAKSRCQPLGPDYTSPICGRAAIWCPNSTHSSHSEVTIVEGPRRLTEWKPEAR